MSYLTPDGGARLPQLRLRSDRHRAGHRLHPRHRCAARCKTLGNFWVDIDPRHLWVLLPICFVLCAVRWFRKESCRICDPTTR